MSVPANTPAAPATSPAKEATPTVEDRRAQITAYLAEQKKPEQANGATAPQTPAAPAEKPAAEKPVAEAKPEAPKPAPEPKAIDKERLDLDLEKKRWKKENADALADAKFIRDLRSRTSDPAAILEALGIPLPDAYKRLTYKLAPDADPEKVTPEQKELRAIKAKQEAMEREREDEKKAAAAAQRERDRFMKYAEAKDSITKARDKYGVVADLGDNAIWEVVDRIERHYTESKEAGEPRMLSMSEALDIVLPDAQNIARQLSEAPSIEALVVERLKAKGWKSPEQPAAPAAQPEKSAPANVPETVDSQSAASRPSGSTTDEEVILNPYSSRAERNAAAKRLAGLRK